MPPTIIDRCQALQPKTAVSSLTAVFSCLSLLQVGIHGGDEILAQ